MPTRLALKHCFSFVIAILLSASVYFQAVGAARLMGEGLVAIVRSLAGLGASPPPEAPSSAETPPAGAALVAPSPPRSAASAPPGSPSPLTWPACDDVRAVVVTESSDPTWSAAVLQIAGEARPRTHRVGGVVGERKVTFIGYNPREHLPAVWLEGGRGACQALLLGAEAPLVAAADLGAARAAAPAPGVGRDAERATFLASKLRRMGEGEFDVDRSLVEHVTQDPTELMRVRVVPETKDGRVVGLRLFGVRAGTLLDLLGIQNGDRLESINGHDLTSPESALRAYALLRTADRFQVKLHRAGQLKAIDVRIL